MERELEILQSVTNIQWQSLYIARTEINGRILEIMFSSVGEKNVSYH